MNTSKNNATSNIRELLIEQMRSNGISALDVLEWLGLDDNVCETIHKNLVVYQMMTYHVPLRK